MITRHGSTWHLTIGACLLVLDDDAMTMAIRRGKAYKRAEAMRSREAQAAEAAERKRSKILKGDA